MGTRATVDPVLIDRPADSARPCLVWRWDEPVEAISSATLGGGRRRIRWVIDLEVDHTYDRLDPGAHLAEVAGALGLGGLGGLGVGLMTAAPVARWTAGTDGGAVVHGTVGVTRPTWAADDDGVHGSWRPDTINLVVQLPVRLSEAAMVNAVMTITEAKAQALAERGVPGTGTASDAVCVVCPADGAEEPFAGPRSPWGARLARAAHHCVLAGLGAP
ncbi:MAG: adenosylcobinamide amidohydrolase [Actinomycetota bacterium]